MLTALPDLPPLLAAWSTVTVHRDAHIQHHRALYSVPFALFGKATWEHRLAGRTLHSEGAFPADNCDARVSLLMACAEAWR